MKNPVGKFRNACRSASTFLIAAPLRGKDGRRMARLFVKKTGAAGLVFLEEDGRRIPVLAAISEAKPHQASNRILADAGHLTHPPTGGSPPGLTRARELSGGLSL